MEERLINKRRFKVLQVPFDTVLLIIKDQIGDFRMPEDAIVQDVRHSWATDSFEFKVNSGSYPETPEGVVAERIKCKWKARKQPETQKKE